jgi:flagellar basal-body rod protein FlgF
MHNALYVGLSRQMTLRRALDIAANNMANADTAGFKVEQQMVETDPLQPKRAPGQSPVNYVLDTGMARDFRQGTLERTGNTYDVSVEGQGFFTVNTPAGPRYTRDGRFAVDAQNRLVDKAGNAVLDASGAEIALDPQKAAPAIGKDGTITQADPRGQTVQVGKLGVVRFANLSGLSKQGDNLFAAPPGEQPIQAGDAVVRQGEVEHSNVQPVLEISNLIEITRAYERVTQMIASTQDLCTRAVDQLGRWS